MLVIFKLLTTCIKGDDVVSLVSKLLVHLVVAEVTGTTGAVYRDLVMIHTKGTCTNKLKSLSLTACF